jgi:DNA-binding CsgD family transcriptional regulator
LLIQEEFGMLAYARTESRPVHDIVFIGLTRREREVLALLCQRFTDPEIADRLCISVRTVESHVGRIFGKLEVTNRRAAASTAVVLGLVSQAGAELEAYPVAAPQRRIPLELSTLY